MGQVMTEDLDPKVEKARAVHARITKDLWDVCAKHQTAEAGSTEDKIGFVQFGRLMMISLAHASAVCAVDTLMNEGHFIEMCRENYKLADAAAPKFS